MHTPLVSVIIPTHDRVNLVPTAIDSALAQTFGDIEVVVVDDGSADGTPETLEEQYRADERVRIISRVNGGVAAARNTGIEHARGDFIAFLDSDDRWAPWKLELQVACMERDPDLGMIWTDMSAFDDEGTVAERYLRTMYRNIRDRRLGELFDRRTPLGPSAPRTRPDLARIPVYSGDVFTTMLLGSIVHTSTVLARATILEKVGGFDESLRPNGEDYDFHLRTTEIATVGFVDLPTIGYRIGAEDQLSGAGQMVTLARNALRTVTTRLEAAIGDSRVTPEIRKHALAEAHGWLGRELVDAGRGACGFRHLARSLMLRPSRRTGRALVRAVVRRRRDHAEGAGGRSG